MNKITLIFALTLFVSCSNPDESYRPFYGFWEGPHPTDLNKKFYVRIALADSCTVQGYWTEYGLYSSSFEIDSLHIQSNTISFYVPNWNCTYRGELSGQVISGGFACPGEALDSVRLIKNDTIKAVLTEALPGCLDSNFKYNCKTPPNLNDGLQVAHPQSQNELEFIDKLLPEILNGYYGRINSFLLLKNKRLVCEEYFYGYKRSTLHQAESSTKSITSLLVGIVIDKGFITDLNEPVADILDAQGFDQRITVKHLLSMTSGLEPNDADLINSEDRIKTVLSRQLNNVPGTVFQYDGGNTELLGAIIKKKTGEFADAFARKFLFEPLNISHYNWEFGKQNGYPCMAGSLLLTPREMIKIGLLVLNKGSFNEQTVISQKWIEKSTSFKTHTNISGDDYAYQWWNITLESEGEKYPCIWANGWGSQFIYIFPTLDAVIVTTGHNYEFDSWAITSGIEKYLYLLN